MTDKEQEEWERDPELRAWMLERERLTDLWERNYGMDSMDFFYRKCLECLQYVMDLHRDSEWCKGAFINKLSLSIFRSLTPRRPSPHFPGRFTVESIGVYP